MRKCAFALIAICFLMLSSHVAYADVIIEPDNRFFNRHRNQIVYLGRSFSANGTDGYASVVRAPGSGREIAKLQNGDVVYLQFSCLYNGNHWGFTFQFSGWIKIDDLLVFAMPIWTKTGVNGDLWRTYTEAETFGFALATR
jgi:hypothetical protein